jgi:predicted branched-subunit amino acid permease
MRASDSRELVKGYKDALPVFLGYLAVSFTVGISARNAGLTAFQAALMSLLNTTSAGQVAAIEIIGSGGTYLEIVLSQIAINLRYLLMGAVLSVRLSKDESTGRRLLAGFGLTDEVFALSCTRKPLNPYYPFGGWLMAAPGWVIGTFLGVIVNTFVPANVTAALSIGLYAMFIAIIIPPARKELKMAVLVIVSMLCSFLMFRFIPSISSGMRVVILTVIISSVFSLLFPVTEEAAS